MFDIGSYVSYRSEGVCVISDIRDESFGAIGVSERYYILTPINDSKSTVFVPVANENLVKCMRKLLTAAEIDEMLCELRNERMEWITDSRVRNAAFKEVLAMGDRRQLVVLVNTLSEKLEEIVAAGRKVGSTDVNALRRAEKMLFEEFSTTTDIASVEKVVPILLGDIRLSDKTVGS